MPTFRQDCKISQCSSALITAVIGVIFLLPCPQGLGPSLLFSKGVAKSWRNNEVVENMTRGISSEDLLPCQIIHDVAALLSRTTSRAVGSTKLVQLVRLLIAMSKTLSLHGARSPWWDVLSMSHLKEKDGHVCCHFLGWRVFDEFRRKSMLPLLPPTILVLSCSVIPMRCLLWCIWPLIIAVISVLVALDQAAKSIPGQWAPLDHGQLHMDNLPAIKNHVHARDWGRRGFVHPPHTVNCVGQVPRTLMLQLEGGHAVKVCIGMPEYLF